MAAAIAPLFLPPRPLKGGRGYKKDQIFPPTQKGKKKAPKKRHQMLPDRQAKGPLWGCLHKKETSGPVAFKKDYRTGVFSVIHGCSPKEAVEGATHLFTFALPSIPPFLLFPFFPFAFATKAKGWLRSVSPPPLLGGGGVKRGEKKEH